MKAAICFSGQCRALEYTYFNLKEYLIDRVSKSFGCCDVFIHAAIDEYSAGLEDCIQELNPTKVVMEEDKYINEIGLKCHPLQRSLQQYLQMLNSWKQADLLRLQHQEEYGFEYDFVIRTRLDIRLFEPFKIEHYISRIDIEKCIYVPDFHSFAGVQGGGCNDRFAFGNSKNISVYSKMFDYVRQYSDEGLYLHAETCLYYHLDRQKIKYNLLPIRFTRVRPGNIELDGHLRFSAQWRDKDI